jgi:Fic family protein
MTQPPEQRGIDLWPLEAFAFKGATAEIVGQADELIAKIDRHRPLPADLNRRLMDDLLYDRVYSSAVTEGNRLSRRETIVLLTQGVVDAGTRRDRSEVQNLGKAILQVDDWLRDQVEFSEGLLRELHKIVIGDLDPSNAGAYRLEDVAISGSETVPPPAGDVPDLVRQTVDTVRVNVETAHPLQLGAWAHWAITRIHPFRDGNGRIARLVQDYILLRRGYIPAPLFSEDRQGQYYEALELADKGTPQTLVELLTKNVLRVADRCLSAIDEVGETATWLDSLVHAASEHARETTHRRFIKWDRRVKLLVGEFHALVEELRERLGRNVPDFWFNFKRYGDLDFGKYQSLLAQGRAERSWLFGLDLAYEGERLRFVFWVASHWRRPSDPVPDITREPVVLVSVEEEGGIYKRLDEMGDDRITLREIAIADDTFRRRRWDPVTEEDRWDFNISAGQIARDFLTEALRKMQLL